MDHSRTYLRTASSSRPAAGDAPRHSIRRAVGVDCEVDWPRPGWALAGCQGGWRVTLRRRAGYATRAAAFVLTAGAALLVETSFLGQLPALTSASISESQAFGAFNATAGTSLSASPTSATTAGDTLVASIRARNTSVKAAVTSVTDSHGDVW